jgi:hypothetical protein
MNAVPMTKRITRIATDRCILATETGAGGFVVLARKEPWGAPALSVDL